MSSAKERSFVQPPALVEEGVAKVAAVNGGPSPCEPHGTVKRNGAIVDVRLDFMRAKFSIDNPDPSDPRGGEDPVELRSFGGCNTGPAVFVKPGDTLRLNLSNQTDKADPTCTDPQRAGTSPAECFNTTNLHSHGLHVSPAGNSDNVLLNIPPQTAFPYEINIPADHPSGTFWYHPHRHGSTAAQVASGAAGVLVVKGSRPYTAPTALDPHPIADVDTILHTPDGAPFPEKLFLFQQIAYACFANDPANPAQWWQNIYTRDGLYNAGNANDSTGPAVAPWTCPLPAPGKPVSAGAVENFQLQLFSPTIWDTNGRFTSTNGVVQPTLTVPAGQIQRWRFVHAGIHDTINVQIVRATPVGGLIANSALSGNRQEQKAALVGACNATPETLIPQLEIATDGLTRAKIHTIHAQPVNGQLQESNYLQPGYRSDILVVFPQDGDYCLLNQAAPAKARLAGQGPSTPELLAYIHVRGGKAVTGPIEEFVGKTLHAANPTLPPAVRDGLLVGDLRPWAPFLELPAPPAGSSVQPAHFEIGKAGFTINGQSYKPDVVNIKRQVNTLDDWLLTSSGEPHVFHIHVNPFEILDVTTENPLTHQQESIFDQNGKCKTPEAGDQSGLASQYCGMYHVFRDTVFVENGYQIHIRTRYERYIGEYVLHCHILDHEDAGMMLNIAIVPDLSAPGGGIGMGAMHHDAALQPAAHVMPATMTQPAQ
ncbi:multicopper oxidase family protein [Labrys neptuniae]